MPCLENSCVFCVSDLNAVSSSALDPESGQRQRVHIWARKMGFLQEIFFSEESFLEPWSSSWKSNNNKKYILLVKGNTFFTVNIFLFFVEKLSIRMKSYADSAHVDFNHFIKSWNCKIHAGNLNVHLKTCHRIQVTTCLLYHSLRVMIEDWYRGPTELVQLSAYRGAHIDAMSLVVI